MGTIDDITIRRYLLGQADDAEQQQVEEALLSDESGRLHIGVVEDELIEQYLAGELPADERSSFESHFLAAESRRQNLRFSQAFRKYMEEHPEANPRPATARAGWPILRLKFALALAAAAVIAAAWLALSYRDSRGELPAQPEAARSGSEPVPAPAQIAVLTLTPGLLRSGGQEPVLRTRPTGTSLELHLVLPQEGFGFGSYSAKLGTVEGKEVWRQTGLQREGDTIRVAIPTSLLTRGDWRVAVSGASAQGKTSEVSSYYFRILFD